jgi:hypothetical protein
MARKRFAVRKRTEARIAIVAVAMTMGIEGSLAME